MADEDDQGERAPEETSGGDASSKKGDSSDPSMAQPGGESHDEHRAPADDATPKDDATPDARPRAASEGEPHPPSEGDPAGPGDENPPNSHETKKAAAWGRPLVRFDEAWTRLEARLCVGVLLLEVLSLSLWVALKGLSAPPDSESPAGVVFRGLIGALVLGAVGYFAPRKQSLQVRRAISMGGVVLGIALAKAWANVGVSFGSNLLNWYQQASSLTLLGGLRGVGTRLTLWLALLGGSLATGAGKHITIDLITRFLKPKARLPVVLSGWLGAAVICASASWGFFDHISIDSFGADADARPSAKVSAVTKGLGENFFVLRRQLSLDLKTLPHVMRGEPYADWLTGTEWNQWIDDSGFAERYGKEAAEGLKIGADDRRAPAVLIPGKGEMRGDLIDTANLVFPFGLLMIAIRFVLLSLLVLSGHKSIEETGEGMDIERPAGDHLEEGGGA